MVLRYIDDLEKYFYFFCDYILFRLLLSYWPVRMCQQDGQLVFGS
jgi:hypothetical protein